jgi:CRISPR-associated protein (TIGR03986 family)
MKEKTDPCGPGWAERRGDRLTGELSYRRDGRQAAQRTWEPRLFDAVLAGWFSHASDGDGLEIFVDVGRRSGQPVRVRMAHPGLDLLREVLGSAPNPYTFIPTPPRAGMPPGLANGPAPPHGMIDTSAQWSGWLVLRLAARTPMLLPDHEKCREDANTKHRTYPVRERDGKPFLHGASVKGALRSAYEAVTNSRYGVFRDHDRPLGYRRPASQQDRPKPVPARVEADGRGGLQFQLCDPVAVPLYDPPARPGQAAKPRRKAQAVAAAQTRIKQADGALDWRALHGAEVVCTIRQAGRPPRTRPVVDTVRLASDRSAGAAAGGPIRRGWLLITGQTIENKTSERIFVLMDKPPIAVEEQHHTMWHLVLASYHEVAELQERNRDPDAAPRQRSPHIVVDGEVPARLEEGDLVYLERNPQTDKVTAVLPVYIARLPYQVAPSELLDKSLHPATGPGELSPADRLFGWAPPETGAGRRSASGYRGRLRVTSVDCGTKDWRTDHGERGVTIAPLNSPKPTQFRFYAAAGSDGKPVGRGLPKDEGYQDGQGLRGRKAYWYPSTVPDEYWSAAPGKVAGRFREWQEPPDAKPSQTSTHLGWVREGTEFTVRLFLDGVPGTELGPLIWLATQDGCPLRLGAGKPLGFGAVTVEIDWDSTELRTQQALRNCWLDLHRPDPATQEQVKALAEEFERSMSSRELADILAVFKRVAAGLPEPACYPRTQRAPEAETYRWFVENERIEKRRIRYGFALPHALEDNQDLPFLPRDGR